MYSYFLACNCDLTGAVNPMTCDSYGGQCVCKPGVMGRRCNECKPGFFNFTQNGCQGIQIIFYYRQCLLYLFKHLKLDQKNLENRGKF